MRFYGKIVQIYLSGRVGGEMERRARKWNVAGTLLSKTHTCIYEKLYQYHHQYYHHHLMNSSLNYCIHLPLDIHFNCMYALS